MKTKKTTNIMSNKSIHVYSGCNDWGLYCLKNLYMYEVLNIKSIKIIILYIFFF